MNDVYMKVFINQEMEPTGRCGVRDRPNQEYEEIGFLYHGEKVKEVGRHLGFFQVEQLYCNTDQSWAMGWVESEYLVYVD